MNNSNAVDAITSYDCIRAIREKLEVRPLELLLFEMGISSGMRIKELLALRVRDMTSGSSGYCLAEPKVKTAFEKYSEVWNPRPDDYVFRKLRKNEPLAFSAVTTMVKSWFTECGLKGNFSSRSLYKTWETMSAYRGGVHSEQSPGTTAYALTPIDTNSVQNQVQERMYKAIITGSIPAGTKLVVSRLAQQMECNMVQVRVALAHLEEQGLVETRTAKTCVVRSLTPRDLHEISRLRMLLEGYAMDIVRDKWSAETAAILARVLEKWRISHDVGECVHLHSVFHEMMYRDTHMPILLDYIKNLAGRMNGMHMKYYLDQHRHEVVMDDEVDVHQELFDYMAAGDFESGKESAMKNIRLGEEDCLLFLSMLENQRSTDDKTRGAK